MYIIVLIIWKYSLWSLTLKIHVFRHVMLCQLVNSYRCFKSCIVFKMSVTFYQSTWCNNPQGVDVQQHFCENLTKSHFAEPDFVAVQWHGHCTSCDHLLCLFHCFGLEINLSLL
jgi:hypothetical protein